MPSNTVRLAWSIPVPVVEFGAHFEAYCKLRPTIHTLRLCNRYGQGEKAAITKVPIEIVDHIESFLIEPGRTQRLEEWRRCFRCWEGKCESIDHLEDEDLLKFYNREMKYCHDEDDSDGEREPKTKVTAEVKDYCRKYIPIVEQVQSRHIWCRKHEDNIDYWFSLLEKLGEGNQYGAILQKEFGLAAFVGHIKGERCYAQKRRRGSTIAYLYLIDAWSFSDDWMLDQRPYETQQAFAVVPKIPATPSTKSLARFARAVKTLGLLVSVVMPGEESIKESEGDDERKTEEHDAGHVGRPELRLLTKIDTE